MFQVRIHGRGGQGVVSAAEMLSLAAFDEGCHAQAFPSFGSERMGAPVTAYCRIDDKEIRLREPVMQPDALIIQDPTLLHQVDLFNGLSPSGYILINSTRSFDELGAGADAVLEPFTAEQRRVSYATARMDFYHATFITGEALVIGGAIVICLGFLGLIKRDASHATARRLDLRALGEGPPAV